MKYLRVFLVGAIGAILILGAAAIEPISVTPSAMPEVVIAPEQVAFNQAIAPVYFEYNDAQLGAATETALEQDVKWLKEHPEVSFYINGYTDWRGEVLFNMTLSQRRADAVKAALAKMGIAPERVILSVGWGKLYPTCGDLTDACLKQNRRVRLVYGGPAKSSFRAAQDVTPDSPPTEAPVTAAPQPQAADKPEPRIQTYRHQDKFAFLTAASVRKAPVDKPVLKTATAVETGQETRRKQCEALRDKPGQTWPCYCVTGNY